MSDLSSLPAFQQTQYQFAAHLRDPENCTPPPAMEDRRLGIYRELVYNNIHNFINGGFPVLCEILGSSRVNDLVREFIVDYRCRSPYFLEISQEFLLFLQEHCQLAAGDPAFMLELAHYEWVELALDVSEEELPVGSGADSGMNDKDLSHQELTDTRFTVSPLAWSLSYTFPVHQIAVNFQPTEPSEQATFLVVYRNRDEQVQFIEVNAVSARLLQLLRSEAATGEQVLLSIADELKHPEPAQILEFGYEILSELSRLEIIFPDS